MEKAVGAYIGDIGFFNFVKLHDRVELGYRLFTRYRGRGIMTGFIRQLVDYGFAEKKYDRIEAMVDSRNEASKRVLLKNDFILEGIMREYEFEYGSFVDLEMYSLLKRDYAVKS